MRVPLLLVFGNEGAVVRDFFIFVKKENCKQKKGSTYMKREHKEDTGVRDFSIFFLENTHCM